MAVSGVEVAAQPAPPPAPPPAVRRRRGQVTVGTFTAISTLGAVIVLLAVVLGLVLAAAAAGARDGLVVIGYRTAPQVTATEDLYFALSDMDAQLTNVLLAGDDDSLVTIRNDGLAAIERRRTQANADVLQAAAVAGTDEAAQQTVREVLDGVGRYEALAAQMILLNDQERNPAGRPSAGVLDLHRQATDLMSATLRTAHRLTEINSAVLDQSYLDKQAATVTARWWVGLLGGMLIVALVGLQAVLRVRLRRRINVALVLATILSGWLVFGGVTVLASESEFLRVAKKDAFNSLLALRQARAVSYDANADESRFLVDPGRGNQYEQAFHTKSESLAAVGSSGVRQYDAALEAALVAYAADNKDVRFGGFFGTALNNITFVGERAAAEKTVAAFQVYQRDDRTIRALGERGDLRAAIAFCTSTEPGNSNFDFYAYDEALAAFIDINQRAFDQAIADGERLIDDWTTLFPYGGGALIVVLVAIGVRPRLAEYR